MREHDVKHANMASSSEHDIELVPGQDGRTNDSVYEKGVETRDDGEEGGEDRDKDIKEESMSDDMFGHHNDNVSRMSTLTTAGGGLTPRERSDV